MQFKSIRLLNACDVYQPKTIATKYFVPDGKYTVYGANGEIGQYDEYNHEEPEVLMACRGATCGTINVSKPFSWINGNAMVIHPNGTVPLRKDYLKYYLMSVSKDSIISGTAQPQITRQNLKDFQIVICDLDDQQKIVSQIEESLSQLDNAVETLNKTKQQLEIYRQAVLKEAFAECDSTVTIQSVCEHVTDGDHMPPPKAHEGVPFIMISNISNNHIQWDNTAHVGIDYYNQLDNKRKPQLGDVLYTVTGSFGIPVLVDFEKEFCFQRHIALLRPNEQINPEYFSYALQTPSVFKQAKDRATGTAQKTVGLNVLRKIEIPFTNSLEKQIRIAERIKQQLSICSNIEQKVNQSLQHAKALRQSILKQAFEEDKNV